MSNVDADLDFLFGFLQEPPRVRHSRLDHWRAELAQRVWRQRSLIKRRGFVGEDWDSLIEEMEEFSFVEQSMADEIARRRAKQEEYEAAA